MPTTGETAILFHRASKQVLLEQDIQSCQTCFPPKPAKMRQSDQALEERQAHQISEMVGVDISLMDVLPVFCHSFRSRARYT